MWDCEFHIGVIRKCRHRILDAGLDDILAMPTTNSLCKKYEFIKDRLMPNNVHKMLKPAVTTAALSGS